MDTVYLVLVVVLFSVALTCCFTVAVCMSKKIRALSRKVYRLEKMLKAVRE